MLLHIISCDLKLSEIRGRPVSRPLGRLGSIARLVRHHPSRILCTPKSSRQLNVPADYTNLIYLLCLFPLMNVDWTANLHRR